MIGFLDKNVKNCERNTNPCLGRSLLCEMRQTLKSFLKTCEPESRPHPFITEQLGKKHKFGKSPTNSHKHFLFRMYSDFLTSHGFGKIQTSRILTTNFNFCFESHICYHPLATKIRRPRIFLQSTRCTAMDDRSHVNIPITCECTRTLWPPLIDVK